MEGAQAGSQSKLTTYTPKVAKHCEHQARGRWNSRVRDERWAVKVIGGIVVERGDITGMRGMAIYM